MTPMRTALAVIAIAAAVATPTATARPAPPTADQATAVSTAVSEQESCLQITVSGVDDRWAEAQFLGAAGGRACRQVARGDVFLQRLPDYEWVVTARFVIRGDRRCPLEGVPTAVAVDFNACARARDQLCGHVRIHGGDGELHATGTSCVVARQVLARRIKRRALPAGWSCRGGGTNGAVYATCNRGARTATLYQPASVYGE